MTTYDGAAQDWPTETRWHCQQCDATGTVQHEATTPIWRVVALLGGDHAARAPQCHAHRSLYHVRIRTRREAPTLHDGGPLSTPDAASVRST